MDQTKKWWQSKTIWINAIMAGAAFVPAASEWLNANPSVLPLVFMAVNMVMRLITKSAVDPIV